VVPNHITHFFFPSQRKKFNEVSPLSFANHLRTHAHTTKLLNTSLYPKLTPHNSDPSIKAILLKIDADNNHMYIIEDLDESTLVVKENKLNEFKYHLDALLKRTSMQEREEESSGDEEGDM
jgi:TFIIH basal transcription factor complex TTD-A subunit